MDVFWSELHSCVQLPRKLCNSCSWILLFLLTVPLFWWNMAGMNGLCCAEREVWNPKPPSGLDLGAYDPLRGRWNDPSHQQFLGAKFKAVDSTRSQGTWKLDTGTPMSLCESSLASVNKNCEIVDWATAGSKEFYCWPCHWCDITWTNLRHPILKMLALTSRGLGFPIC